MSVSLPPYEIFPLGDTALTLDFGNIIREEVNLEIIRLFSAVNSSPLTGMTEAVPAYSSLTIFYDPLLVPKPAGMTSFKYMQYKLEDLIRNRNPAEVSPGRSVLIPVCYEEKFGPDLLAMATKTSLSIEEIIQLHTDPEYRVYMMGFIPGFAYMGIVNEKIAFPRKPLPENVQAGSVGIAGSQTGIYPLNSPGGWQIIGRTPIKLFDPSEKDPVLLRAGDRIRFYSINSDEFKDHKTGIA